MRKKVSRQLSAGVASPSLAKARVLSFTAGIFVVISLPVSAHVGMMAGLMLRPEQQRERSLANHYLWIRPSVSAASVKNTR